MLSAQWVGELMVGFACSREFAHRVKGISMSKFTEAEVKNLIKFGGNEVRSLCIIAQSVRS